MNLRHFRHLPLAAFAVVALTFTAGCDDDNPAAPGTDSEHQDFEGVVVELADGTELVRQFEGSITGEISLPAGTTLADLEVWFLDENQDKARPGDDHDHDHGGNALFRDEDHDHDDHDHAEEMEWELAYEVTDPNVASLNHTTGELWAVDVQGVAEGQTTVRFMIMHDGHADFTSLALPVRVEPATSTQ